MMKWGQRSLSLQLSCDSYSLQDGDGVVGPRVNQEGEHNVPNQPQGQEFPNTYSPKLLAPSPDHLVEQFTSSWSYVLAFPQLPRSSPGFSFWCQNGLSGEGFAIWYRSSLWQSSSRSISPHLGKKIMTNQLGCLDQVLLTEWCLLPRVFDAICKEYRCSLIDLFATRASAKLSFYVSPVPILVAWKETPSSAVGTISTSVPFLHSLF